MSAAPREDQLYRKVEKVEREVRDLKILLLKRRVGQRVSNHPVPLAGMWAGADITDDDIRNAKRALFHFDEEHS